LIYLLIQFEYIIQSYNYSSQVNVMSWQCFLIFDEKFLDDHKIVIKPFIKRNKVQYN